MKAYVHTKTASSGGKYDSYCTHEVECKVTKRPLKGRTLSGYGKSLPTEYMIKWQGRWYRVKAICFSNCATFYIGTTYSPCMTVSIGEE